MGTLYSGGWDPRARPDFSNLAAMANCGRGQSWACSDLLRCEPSAIPLSPRVQMSPLWAASLPAGWPWTLDASPRHSSSATQGPCLSFWQLCAQCTAQRSAGSSSVFVKWKRALWPAVTCTKSIFLVTSVKLLTALAAGFSCQPCLLKFLKLSLKNLPEVWFGGQLSHVMTRWQGSAYLLFSKPHFFSSIKWTWKSRSASHGGLL